LPRVEAENPKPEQSPLRQKAIRKVDDQVAQFAYLTRAGRNHEKTPKTNQDNFFVVKNFAKIENLWFFGVADGHG
jgi:serine/threonine protein phosphatase PrpC